MSKNLEDTKPSLHAALAERRMRAIAQEIARDIQPLHMILDAHSVTEQQWSKMTRSPLFQRMVAEEVEVWSSSLNTEERIKHKMQSAVEQSLPEMFARLHDPREPLAAKVALWTQMMKGGSIGTKDESAGAPKISISIDMGSQRVNVVHDVTPKVIDAEAEELETAEYGEAFTRIFSDVRPEPLPIDVEVEVPTFEPVAVEVPSLDELLSTISTGPTEGTLSEEEANRRASKVDSAATSPNFLKTYA